ncbi:MAG: hydroxyacid dehydrogenase [Planctomycetota bacterium]
MNIRHPQAARPVPIVSMRALRPSGETRCKAAVCLHLDAFEKIYGPTFQSDLSDRLDFAHVLLTPEQVAAEPSLLADAELLFAGWGTPRLDRRLLDANPNLKMVFYGSGSIRQLVTDDFWDRGLRVTSAYAANAIPVAEFTLSQIIFCLKQGYRQIDAYARLRRKPGPTEAPGGFGSTVGIVSLGMIGAMVCRRLQSMDVRVLAYDPFASQERARKLGVEMVSLDDVFRRSDVVSLHAPSLKETRGMIRGEHFASMKASAGFINTSRGAVVREAEMIAALQKRPDLTAVLDVTDPEPPVADSPMWGMENVILLPHIAGSYGQECRRMGQFMLEELDNYEAGRPLKWEINRDAAAIMA